MSKYLNWFFFFFLSCSFFPPSRSNFQHQQARKIFSLITFKLSVITDMIIANYLNSIIIYWNMIWDYCTKELRSNGKKILFENFQFSSIKAIVACPYRCETGIVLLLLLFHTKSIRCFSVLLKIYSQTSDFSALLIERNTKAFLSGVTFSWYYFSSGIKHLHVRHPQRERIAPKLLRFIKCYGKYPKLTLIVEGFIKVSRSCFMSIVRNFTLSHTKIDKRHENKLEKFRF